MKHYYRTCTGAWVDLATLECASVASRTKNWIVTGEGSSWFEKLHEAESEAEAQAWLDDFMRKLIKEGKL